MKIIFEEKGNNKRLTFGDVPENQFFVCPDGALWQKVGPNVANQITDDTGSLYADQSNSWDDDDEIDRIIPNISKIEY